MARAFGTFLGRKGQEKCFKTWIPGQARNDIKMFPGLPRHFVPRNDDIRI